IIIGSVIMFTIRGKRLVTTDLTTKRERPTAFMLFALIALMFGIQIVMILINLVFQPLLGQVDASSTDAMDDAMSSILSTPLGLLYVILIGPIFEEIVFRGAVLRKLEPYGANFAMVISALLFGLYHVFLFQAVFAFFVGLIFAYTAGRYSIKWAMILHILNNLLACLADINEAVAVVIILLYLAGFIISIILLITKRNVLKTQKVAGAPAIPRVFKTAFSSPWLISYMVVLSFFGVLLLFP
ncbi:MAG: CPBP family intramembrane metalloprotease, partial [Coriobacteriia bacterium]|nr:CPBP family intramembrane metalloprotease [Coriobacteriia bacterium]